MRPDGKARRARIPGVFERGATQPAGMQRRPNAAGVSPRAAKQRLDRARPDRAIVNLIDLEEYHASERSCSQTSTDQTRIVVYTVDAREVIRGMRDAGVRASSVRCADRRPCAVMARPRTVCARNVTG